MRRHLRAQKHHRTRDEERELRRRSAERRAARRHGGRRDGRRDLAPEDELEEFEPIRRAPRGPLGPGRSDERAGRAAERGPDAPDVAGRTVGVVVSLAPGRARVLVEGTERAAALADELARTQRASVAVGDEVALEPRGPGEWRVVAVLPRRTLLSRPDPARPDLERAVVANVDVAAVVVAVRRPAFRPRLVDRYLVALDRGGIAPVVCASKADLLEGDAERARVEEALEPLRELGVPALLTSGATGEGIAELRRHVAGRAVVFVGQSGVGKSSLLNALDPSLGLATGAVRRGDGKGRHTTTSSRRMLLADGTCVVDTPGVRAFGLADLGPAELARSFPELSGPGAACHFRDCTHAHEPRCVVRAAVEAGRVPRARYEAYLRILASSG